MIHSDDPKITLLKECYALLDDIRDEGVYKSAIIPGLLARIVPFIFSPIPYEEVSTVRFRCPGCQSVMLEVLRSDWATWDHITCDCGKRYRVVWCEGESKAYILEDVQP
jgi:hypothetical protein